MDWTITKTRNFPKKLNNPVLITCVPGIGNVGKIVGDYILEHKKPKKIATFFSYHMPNIVYVGQNHLVDMPHMGLYHLGGKQDILILLGDFQPTNEESCFSFCETVLDVVEEFNCKEVLTLGGIGLNEIPEKPKVYVTGNNKKFVNTFKKDIVDHKLYGVVGPIVGITGLLLGLAQRRKINGASLLSETLNHPMYLGLRGAHVIINVLNHHLKLKVPLHQLDEEIKAVESELRSAEDMISKKYKSIQPQIKNEVNYIG